MKAETFVKKYDRRVLEDAGTCNSQEFIAFAENFRSVVKEVAKKIGAELVSFSVGHYFFSGFVSRDGKFVYFSYDLPRHMTLDLSRSDSWQGILVRTAKHPKDYTGGSNRFCNIMQMEKLVDQLLR